MPLELDGTTYYSGNEMVEALGVSRQTFWRWRREGLVPQGRRFRDRQLLFTAADLQQAREYANRVEPLDPGIDRDQLKLFHGAV